MKKAARNTLVTLCLAGAVTVMFALGVNAADYKWRLGTIYSDPTTSTTYNAFGESTQKFCELVAEYTDGAVEVTPFYDSVLGPSADLYDQCSTDEIQVFYGQPMSTIDPRYGITSIPGLFATYADVEKVFSPGTEFFNLMDSVLNEDNMILLGSNNAVFRVFYNSKKDIHLPEDLKGLTVRIYEDKICQAYWSGLCAASVIPYSELFMSLQTGVVDGAEHTQSFGPSTGYQVCKYCSDINWQWTWGGALCVNADAFNELPEDLQEQVRKAAVDAAAFYNEIWADYDSKCKDTMEELGMTYTVLTDEEHAAWTEYGDSLTDQFIDIIGEDFFKEAKAVIDAAKG